MAENAYTLKLGQENTNFCNAGHTTLTTLWEEKYRYRMRLMEGKLGCTLIELNTCCEQLLYPRSYQSVNLQPRLSFLMDDLSTQLNSLRKIPPKPGILETIDLSSLGRIGTFIGSVAKDKGYNLSSLSEALGTKKLVISLGKVGLPENPLYEMQYERDKEFYEHMKKELESTPHIRYTLPKPIPFLPEPTLQSHNTLSKPLPSAYGITLTGTFF